MKSWFKIFWTLTLELTIPSNKKSIFNMFTTENMSNKTTFNLPTECSNYKL